MGEVVCGGAELAGFEPMVIGHGKRVASPRERGFSPVETDPMGIGYRNKMAPQGKTQIKPNILFCQPGLPRQNKSSCRVRVFAIEETR